MTGSRFRVRNDGIRSRGLAPWPSGCKRPLENKMEYIRYSDGSGDSAENVQNCGLLRGAVKRSDAYIQSAKYGYMHQVQTVRYSSQKQQRFRIQQAYNWALRSFLNAVGTTGKQAHGCKARQYIFYQVTLPLQAKPRRKVHVPYNHHSGAYNA